MAYTKQKEISCKICLKGNPKFLGQSIKKKQMNKHSLGDKKNSEMHIILFIHSLIRNILENRLPMTGFYSLCSEYKDETNARSFHEEDVG